MNSVKKSESVLVEKVGAEGSGGAVNYSRPVILFFVLSLKFHCSLNHVPERSSAIISFLFDFLDFFYNLLILLNCKCDYDPLVYFFFICLI